MMNQKLLSKVLATMLAVILTFANFVMTGVYGVKSLATSDSLENQSIVSNNENVKFDAYFKDDKGNKIHTKKQDIQEHVKLFLEIQVEKGYLKNAKIAMLGQDNKNPNFRIATSDKQLDMVENIDKNNNTIALKQIDTGTSIILQIPVASLYSETFDLSNFNKINNITLTGLYIDNNGKQAQIEKTINVRNEWEKQTNIIVEQETKSYIPYEINEKTGTILQTVIKTQIEKNNLPTKQTEINIKVPEINGVKPEKVIVTANNTYATNNQDISKFGKDNWTYNKEDGTIKITVKNEPNENKVSWNKNVKDEYVITYIFKEKLQQVQTSQKVDVVIEAYNNEITKLTATNNLEIKEQETKGHVVETKISSNNQLSKGYLYSNSQKEIEYFENLAINIAYIDLVDTLTIENTIDNYINSKEELNPTTVNNKNYAYYKTTTISKENFERILGQDGYIKIIGKDGERLATFTKETQADENGNYIYNYASEINEITIETSKPVQEGQLEIKHIKSLKGTTDYTKKQIDDFQKLQLKAITTVKNKEATVERYGKIRNIELTKPTTKIEASVNKTNLSTIVKNENVEFKVILKTNDMSCDLYKNPNIEIVLPNNIQEVTIKDVNLLFDDELKIKNYSQYINNTGNIVIKVELEGEQTKYNQNEVSKGSNIVINTDVLVKKLSPTKDETIKTYVTNELATSYETTQNSKGYVETNLKFVAPTGMVTTNTITGYNGKGETVTSVSGEAGIGKLDAKSSAKKATITANVINNYENKINNIKILGRMPVQGNKDVITNSDLSSNLNTSIASLINVTSSGKYTIYYSSNLEATEDLNNVANKWEVASDKTDLNTVKSYLIVFSEYEMNTGDNLSFNYNINIPADIEYGKNVYTNYVVFFDNIKEKETIKDKQIATKVGLSTGEGPNLELSITSDIQNGEDVQEGTIITYTATVENKGNQTVNNITLSGTIPEEAVYMYRDEYGDMCQNFQTAEYSEKIEELKSGEKKSITYKVKVRTLEQVQSKTMSAKALAKVEKYDATFTSKPLENKAVKGYLNTHIETYPSKQDYIEGETIFYITTIKNVNNDPKENVVVTDKLPDGVSFEGANNDGTYNKETNTVTWNLGTIKANATKSVQLTLKASELKQNESIKNITNSMTIKTSEKEIKTNELTVRVAKPQLEIKQTTSTKQKVQEEDVIEYNITIKNVGQVDAKNVVLKDIMPEGLLYRGSTYVVSGKKYESWMGNKQADLNLYTIKAGETVDITIKALADDLEEGKTEKTVTNKATVTAEGMKEIVSNDISHLIIPKVKNSNDPSTSEIQPGTYRISGTAWLDENQDGRRDDNEKTLKDIKVMLVNQETGKIVKDKGTNNNKVQTTNESGAYTFENIEQGKYLVVFYYDTANYGVTKYKQDGIIDSKNSDVISMKVTLNGETVLAGVANSIEIKNQDITNIDMGLIESKKFDLKLDKSISKITVNTATGTKTYDYKDAKLAKVDIKDKELNGSTVIVEYKIKVTNEGGVEGFVKKIVDYIPKDMKFNSELNPEWYMLDSGNAFNASLANTIIKPGETKEVTIILTKKMTNENTGTINNVAEIYEASNDLGLEDIDSTTANKIQSEDDYSLADVIIGVKTGEVYVYMLITLLSVTILGVGIYFINKKVLRKI